MDFDQRARALSQAGIAACIAFAAGVAERALKEGRRVREDAVRGHPEFGRAVERLWEQALRGSSTYDRETEVLHAEISRSIPSLLDAARPDPAIEYIARAISMGLFVLRHPEEAGKYAANAGGAMINLVGTVYTNSEKVQNAERAWQDQAVAALQLWQKGPFSRDVFAPIPEYDRGPVAEGYLEGSLE
jgi:hypothetical protein